MEQRGGLSIAPFVFDSHLYQYNRDASLPELRLYTPIFLGDQIFSCVELRAHKFVRPRLAPLF